MTFNKSPHGSNVPLFLSSRQTHTSRPQDTPTPRPTGTSNYTPRTHLLGLRSAHSPGAERASLSLAPSLSPPGPQSPSTLSSPPSHLQLKPPGLHSLVTLQWPPNQLPARGASQSHVPPQQPHRRPAACASLPPSGPCHPPTSPYPRQSRVYPNPSAPSLHPCPGPSSHLALMAHSRTVREICRQRWHRLCRLDHKVPHPAGYKGGGDEARAHTASALPGDQARHSDSFRSCSPFISKAALSCKFPQTKVMASRVGWAPTPHAGRCCPHCGARLHLCCPGEGQPPCPLLLGGSLWPDLKREGTGVLTCVAS